MGGYIDFIRHDLRNIMADPKVAIAMVLNMRIRAQKYTLLHEIFIHQPYHWLASRLKPNTTLIDIGANIGDTAIFFSMFPTAKRVIAYEPIPRVYAEAKENIRLSPYKSKIELKNLALSDTKKKIPVGSGYLGTPQTNIDEIKPRKAGQSISCITLNEALKGLSRIAIKCDCESSEHRIFTSKADLSDVYAIQIEYHFGFQEIPAVLQSKGFKVKIKRQQDKQMGSIGYIYAWKRLNRHRSEGSHKRNANK